MANMAMKVLCVVAACMVAAAPCMGAISCGQVVGSLSPCLPYLRNGGAPTAGCCNGVRGLNAAAKTKPDRQAVCGCLKGAFPSFPGINPGNAAALPGKCRVNIPYQISPNTDCSKIP